jgi:hypothetical protein
VSCEACSAAAWIGLDGDAGALDAWCEGCQTAARLELADAASVPACPNCGTPLTTGEPRFEELLGSLQHLDAVLAAWAGDPAPLRTILPQRPRYLTDLTPPAVLAGDDAGTRRTLEALARGAFREARNEAEARISAGPAPARVWQALAIAAERSREPALAETAWNRVIELEDAPAARLTRGVLRARRGDFDGAHEDLARAGDGYEARWNRAAVVIIAAVSRGPGVPDPALVARARAEAGPASSYWSDPTVGRLLWTTLLERERARAGDAAVASASASIMRAAEQEFEHGSFWDRAMIVHGHAALGHAAACAEAARPLALELVERLLAEPSLAGVPGAAIRAAVLGARDHLAAAAPAAARTALAPALGREDLRRYRVPCAHCGRGTVGVDEVVEGDDAE